MHTFLGCWPFLGFSVLFQNAPHTNLCAHTHFYVEFYVHIKISKITILCGRIQILCGILCGQKARKPLVFQLFDHIQFLCGHIKFICGGFCEPVFYVNCLRKFKTTRMKPHFMRTRITDKRPHKFLYVTT